MTEPDPLNRTAIARRLKGEVELDRSSARPADYEEIAGRLALGESDAAVAEDLNLQDRTIARLRSDPRFIELYDRLQSEAMLAREEHLRDAEGNPEALLQAAGPLAAATIIELLDDPDPSIRLRTAKAVLETWGIGGKAPAVQVNKGPTFNLFQQPQIHANLQTAVKDLFGVDIHPIPNHVLEEPS